MVPTFVTRLNNYAQDNPSVSITYVYSSTGPSDSITWTVTCKVDGQAKGQGVSPTKAASKEMAARETYQALGLL